MIIDKIESQFSVFALFYDAFIIGVLAFIPVSLLASGDPDFFAQVIWGFASITVAILLMLLFRRYLQSLYLDRRTKSIEQLAIQNGWQFQSNPHNYEVTRNYFPALLNLPDARVQTFKNFLQTPEWSSVDFEYWVYRKTKNGEYKERKIFYTIVYTDLPRPLPNMIFDSSKSRKHQLAPIYSPEQKQSLEGDFDEHFQTYFISNYVIDSLAIITPEVMHSMVDASDYDIEIVGDKVAICGPIRDAEAQLQEMSSKLLSIKKNLMNNIITYRDDRLPYAEGRKSIAPLGMQLKRRKENYVVATIIFILWILFEMWSDLSN